MVCVPGLKRISMIVSERAGSPALLSTPKSSSVVPLRQIQPLSAMSWARTSWSTCAFAPETLSRRWLAAATERENFW